MPENWRNNQATVFDTTGERASERACVRADVNSFDSAISMRA